MSTAYRILKLLRALFPLIVAASVVNAGIAEAGGLTGVEENFPLSLDSPYPTPYLQREWQYYIEYKRTYDDKSAAKTVLLFEFGFPYNAKFKFGVPYDFGQAPPNDIGDIFGVVQYNINQETMWLPGFAVQFGAQAPTSPNARGVDPFGEIMIVSTTTGRTNAFQQVIFNGRYRFNLDMQPGERPFEIEAVIGYSRRINSSLLFVTDYARIWRKEQDIEENLAEVGFRYHVTPLAVLSAGAGFGIGDESPSVIFRTGIQYMF